MHKTILSSFLALIFAVSATASDNVNMLIPLRKGAPIDLPSSASIATKGDNFVIVNMPRSDAKQLKRDLGGLTSVLRSRRVRLANDQARVFADVDPVRQGQELQQPYTGKGVLIGTFDVGIDFNNVNFLDAEGKSRVRKVWYFPDDTAVPEVYDTPEAIAELTTEDRNDYHGTHTLGTSTGSFVTSGIDYRGMAPDAQILVCCGELYNNNILAGVQAMADEAEKLGMPLVINLSLSDTEGPHDGYSPTCLVLDAIAEKYPVVLSAGNNGQDRIALSKQFTSSDNQMNIGILDHWSTALVSGLVDVFSNDSDQFDFTLDFVKGATGQCIASLPASDLPLNELVELDLNELLGDCLTDESIMEIGHGFYPESQRYFLTFFLHLKSVSASERISVVVRCTGNPGQRIDAYCTPTEYNLEFGNVRGYSCEATQDGFNTISDMACGFNTISVGSFNSRDVDSYGNIGQISTFSSHGTTIDGRVLPTVVAPGAKLVSSISSYYGNASAVASYIQPVNGKTYYWGPNQGTSMAAPVVTGSIATWLEAFPDLTPAEISEALIQTASHPSAFDGSEKWGSGLIDSYAALKHLIGRATSTGSVSAEKSRPVIVKHNFGVYDVIAAGHDGAIINVYNVAGALVTSAKVSSGMATVDVSSRPRGVYIVKLQSSIEDNSFKLLH